MTPVNLQLHLTLSKFREGCHLYFESNKLKRKKLNTNMLCYSVSFILYLLLYNEIIIIVMNMLIKKIVMSTW